LGGGWKVKVEVGGGTWRWGGPEVNPVRTAALLKGLVKKFASR